MIMHSVSQFKMSFSHTASRYGFITRASSEEANTPEA